jgi:hypothetical protein
VADPLIDPDKGSQIFATGRKGQGKSVLLRHLFDSFPYDRLVIDPTGDVRADLTRDRMPFTALTDPLPVRLPVDLDGNSQTFVYVPDPGDPAYLDNIDRAIGLALLNGKTCLWIDEVGEVTRSGVTPPNMRRALHHGRHKQLTLMLAGPRPIDVNPLCISQADHDFVFHLPNPADRKRVAENIGWPPKAFDAAVHDLGDHEFLWWCTKTQELTHLPALNLGNNAGKNADTRDRRAAGKEKRPVSQETVAL